jgi:hypothetical protein
VDHAIETYRNAPNDPDLAGLLSLFGCSHRIMHRWRRVGGSVRGYDDQGNEIVNVPLREPVHVIAAYDSARGVERTNVP